MRIWFRKVGDTLESIDKAKTRKQAFEKSIQSWYLKTMGLNLGQDKDSCGLCDMYWHKGCSGCPIYKDTKQGSCGGNQDYLNYVKGGSTPELALEELNYLIKLEKKVSK